MAIADNCVHPDNELLVQGTPLHILLFAYYMDAGDSKVPNSTSAAAS